MKAPNLRSFHKREKSQFQKLAKEYKVPRDIRRRVEKRYDQKIKGE